MSCAKASSLQAALAEQARARKEAEAISISNIMLRHQQLEQKNLQNTQGLTPLKAEWPTTTAQPTKRKVGRPPGSKSTKKKKKKAKVLENPVEIGEVKKEEQSNERGENVGGVISQNNDLPGLAYSRTVRTRKTPNRLSSNEEWTRVMEAPQLKKSKKRSFLIVSRCRSPAPQTQKCSSKKSGERGIPANEKEETLVIRKQEDKQTATKAATVTGSGRKSYIPVRLSSVEEWKRVMESQQLGSPAKKEFKAQKSKVIKSPKVASKKTRTVEQCTGQSPVSASEVERSLFLTTPLSPPKQNGQERAQPKTPMNAKLPEKSKYLSLFGNKREEEEKVVYLVQATNHGIACFNCDTKKSNKWHVFGAKVFCNACAREEKGKKSGEGSCERLKRSRNPHSNKVATEEEPASSNFPLKDYSSLLTINVGDYTGPELKHIADSENERLGIQKDQQPKGAK